MSGAGVGGTRRKPPGTFQALAMRPLGWGGGTHTKWSLPRQTGSAPLAWQNRCQMFSLARQGPPVLEESGGGSLQARVGRTCGGGRDGRGSVEREQDALSLFAFWGQGKRISSYREGARRQIKGAAG